MFHKVRKVHGKVRETGMEDAERILTRTEYGVLATVGPDGYPYGIPVNHLYRNGRLYFTTTPTQGPKNRQQPAPQALCCISDVNIQFFAKTF